MISMYSEHGMGYGPLGSTTATMRIQTSSQTIDKCNSHIANRTNL